MAFALFPDVTNADFGSSVLHKMEQVVETTPTRRISATAEKKET